MPKGMFTQAACLLLERPLTLDDLESSLADYEICKRMETSANWALGGPSLIVSYQPDINGYVSVDLVDQPWPDHMGDPKQEAMLFGAWSMGHFGPFTYPGGLQSAGQQSWAWEPGRTIADRHAAFVRIRSSYAFGAADNDPILPPDYEPLPELEFVTQLALTLLDLPGALCYFNPSGEVLCDREVLLSALEYGRAKDLPPLDIWTNVRLFRINEHWCLMDTVGNRQLDVADVEACFHSDTYEPDAVANFLRNVSLYLLTKGEIIKDGDTMDGPGDTRWQTRAFANSICDPPRDVLRWLPLDGRPVPPEILKAGEDE